MTKIACAQLTSKLDVTENLKKVNSFAKQAKQHGCSALFLPEVFASKGNGKENPKFVVEENNEIYLSIAAIAKQNKIFLLGGSVVYNDNGVFKNRVLNFDQNGKLINYYDKIHLFSCDIETPEKRIKLKESDLYTPGKALVMTTAGELKVGMSVCFDIRFPNMYQEYVKMGANVLSASSAFTVPTGKAHWHKLLQARAIETQCYVVASAQWGVHNENMQSYGHSLIIDPWGDILEDAQEGEKIITAEINLDYLNQVRKKVILRE